MFFVIGELINSTRSDVAKALETKDEAVIRRLARTQVEAWAHAIDVNAGQSVDNEIPDLLWLISVVQDELGADVRLAIDTTNPEAMAAALEACTGRPIINSITNEKSKASLIELAAAVSNVSFGLPNRCLLNRTFLAMLMEAGLDGVIMDPTDKRIMDTLCAARALLGADNYCLQYIKRHKGQRRT